MDVRRQIIMVMNKTKNKGGEVSVSSKGMNNRMLGSTATFISL